MVFCKYFADKNKINLEGNSCRTLLNKLDKIKPPEECLSLYKVLVSFQKVREYCFGSVSKCGYQEKIKNFIDAYENSNMSITVKAHVVSHHLEPLLTTFGSSFGLEAFTEEAPESSHSKFNKYWSGKKYKKADKLSKKFQINLCNCLVAYNFDIVDDISKL